MNLVASHHISYTTLQLHITHGLHLPSFTALTHFHPPLHQSHSCHQSLINPDCLTTPAPHSHTHTYKQHIPCKHCKVLFLPRLTFLSVISSADLPESPPTSADLPESPPASADLPESPPASADLPESPPVSADPTESQMADATTELPESRHATAVYPLSFHVSAVSSALPWWAPVSFAPHGPGYHLTNTFIRK